MYQKSFQWYKLFSVCIVASVSIVCGMSNKSHAVSYSCEDFTNTDIVQVAPYNHPAVIGIGNYSASGTGTSGAFYRDFITLGNTYRFRQGGDATSVKLYFQNQYGYASGVYIKVWRKNGAAFSLVATSENILPSLGSGPALYTVNFAQALTGIQEGDYYGYRIEANLPPVVINKNFFHAQAVSAESGTNFVDQSTVASGFAWETDGSIQQSPFAVAMEFTMSNPDVALIGDSIIAGHPTHYSFLEKLTKTNIPSSISHQLGQLTSYITQNLGIGSQTTSQLAARFNADVLSVKPRVVVIEGGVNDIYGGVITSGTFTSNITSMVSAAQADPAVEKIVLLGILPRTNGTTPQNTKVDEWNMILSGIAATYSKAVYTSAAPLVGQFRAGGPVGNLWDIQPSYDVDGIHFNTAGHGKIAQALRNVICTPSMPTILTPTSGTTLTGTSTVISGTGLVGDIISILNASGVVIGSGVVNGAGTWSLSLSGLNDGTHVFSYFAQDASGNVTPSLGHTLRVTTSLATPTITAPLMGSSLSSSSVTVSGTGEAGSTITLRNESGTVLGSAIVNASGIWTTTITNVSNGTYTWNAQATNTLGLVSSTSTTTFTVAVPVSSGGGYAGGGGGSSPSSPTTPITPSNPTTPTNPTSPTTPTNPSNPTTPIVPVGPNMPTELENAFIWSQQQGMENQNTTFTPESFLSPLTRGELARIMVIFEKNTMGKTIAHNPLCDITTYTDFTAMSETEKLAVQGVCDMGVMGWKNNKIQLLEKFRLHDIVTRAELAAVLARYFYGNFEGSMNNERYTPYLQILKDNKIMNITSQPHMVERKGYVLLMLQRYIDSLQ